MGMFDAAIDYFVRGGVCMWPLLLCSVSVVVIGVERFLYFQRSMCGDAFARDFCGRLYAGDDAGAAGLAEKRMGQAANLAKRFLQLRGDAAEVENQIYTETDRTVDAWERWLDGLQVIIGLSPMLGLLGTITGMMASFDALDERLENPMAVTAGIGEALITTVFGLVISMMGMCIYAYLSGRIKAESRNMDEVANALVLHASMKK